MYQSPRDQLVSFWDVLTKKSGKANQAFRCKQTLQKIKQNNKSIKEYLDYFNQLKDDSDLEIELQRKNGIECKSFIDHELTELFMNGLNKNLQKGITNEIVQRFKTTNVALEDLEEILIVKIEKEKYLKLI